MEILPKAFLFSCEDISLISKSFNYLNSHFPFHSRTSPVDKLVVIVHHCELVYAKPLTIKLVKTLKKIRSCEIPVGLIHYSQ